MPTHELQGLRVLVTRPADQARSLSERIRQQGGEPIDLPLLDIVPIAAKLESTADLARYDMLVFISPNAVEQGLKQLGALPATLQLGVIGEASALRLEQAGYRNVIYPSQPDSEGFLGLSQAQNLQGQRILIVRGVGGRETLAEGMRARGAHVTYLEVYRRRCPHWTAKDLELALAADIIIVSSGEALDNLVRLAKLPDGEGLLTKPLLVFHERIAGRARDLGFTLKPVIMLRPGDDGVLASLLQWVKERKGTE